MAAVLAWFRLEVRRRWRTLLVLTLLVGFAAGTVLTAVAGARRGDTAVERLAGATLPATVQVLPDDPEFDWAAVRALQGVEAVGQMVFGNYELDGLPADGPIPADDHTMRTIERPVIFEGRLADPGRPDEAVVTPNFVETYGRGVGDTVTLRLYRPETLDAAVIDWRGPVSAGEPAAADGPEVPVRIVGVVRSFLLTDVQGDPGWLIPSSALFALYPDSVLGSSGVTSAIVRLETGGEGVGEFKGALAEATGRTDINMWNLAESMVFDGRIVGIETTGLVVFALAASAAAVFLVGQAIARYAAATMQDLRVLGALGLSPRQSITAAAAGPALAGVAGSTAGATASVYAARWFPVGTAALREPAPGVDADWTVLVAGWCAVVLAVTAGAATAAVLALRASRSPYGARRSVVAAAVARAGAPPSLVLGTRLALETDTGPRAVPVRPALLGAVVGVLGTVAALTLAAGVDDARRTPARYGQVHQLEAAFGAHGEEFAPADRVLPVLAADPDVVAVNDSRSAVAAIGDLATTVYSYQPVGAPLDVVVTEGRLPDGPDEIALAPFTATSLGTELGDAIELTGTRADRRLTVTGLAYVPEGEENYNLDGAWVSGAGFDELFDGYAFHAAHIALRDSADPAAVAARLGRSGGAEVTPALQRDHSLELQVIREFPLYLATFLAVLALGAVGHAVAVGVRRRGHDLAVMRALGLTGRQCRAVVVTQALVTALAGLLVGLPLGVAAGRSVWRYVADATVTFYVPPPLQWALVVVIPATLVAAVLLAAWPAHRAASLRVGPALRAE